ncbi:uncharacterized protein [Choristoneura fumiferana]|uniref:uncharacterized protein n=2 Tax=Choristoneura fumiferana TaxID=7141 RepID=UPI003D15B3A2
MSYSSFSSSSESAFLCSDSLTNLNLQRNPLCPLNGHAFVYHARVSRKNERCGNRKKKDNPNCFVKAFRWYTQEHKVPKMRSNDRSDLDEFAAWLDQKYDQFLCDSQRKTAYESRLQIISSVQIAPNKSCNPFRKYRRAADCRNGGDGCEKCNQSFEVIMQAKELSRPASECCFQNRPTSYCNSSKVTVASSDTIVIKKRSKLKKTSCDNQDNELRLTTPEAKVFEITEITEKATLSFPQNTPLVEERHSKNKVVAPPTNAQCQCPEEYVNISETSTQYEEYKYQNGAESMQPTMSTVTAERRSSQTSKFSARVKSSNEKGTPTSCHNSKCPYTKEVKIENDIQYSDRGSISAAAFTSCECPVSKLRSNLEIERANSRQKMRSNTQMNTEFRNNSIREMCNCSLRRRDLDHKLCGYEDTPNKLSSDTAQTSDHSIILDSTAIGGSPLLVRIVAR